MAAAGYDARNVRVAGSLDGPRITLDGGAAAYGGTATARGFIVTPAPGRPLAFDLAGKRRARGPARSFRRPPARRSWRRTCRWPTITSLAEGPSINGTATLNQSTVEGATHRSRHDRGVRPDAVDDLVHGAGRGRRISTSHRLGSALEIDALAQPAYNSRINGSFDVAGSLPRRPASRGAADDPPRRQSQPR